MASIVTFAGSALPLVVAALALMAVSARAQYAGPIPLLRAHGTRGDTSHAFSHFCMI